MKQIRAVYIQRTPVNISSNVFGFLV